MLTEEQLQKVHSFIEQFTREEQLWISGYIAGWQGTAGAGNAPAPPAVKLTIAYGTETGNSKKIATQLAAKAKQKKLTAKLVSLEQYKTADLEKEEVLLVVMSTHGDGEPPAAAKKFYDYLHSTDKPLPKLRYSVLALGDSAYPLFCKAGADVDERLNKLSATALVPRKDCDVDYEADAGLWIEEVLQKISATAGSAATAAPKAAEAKKPGGRVLYNGKVTSTVNLNDRGSAKETYHIEITPDTPAAYAPGDSIGILPVNSEEDVQQVLTALQTIGSDFVQYKGKQFTFYQLLKTTLNIRQLPSRVLQKYAQLEEIPVEIKGNYDLAELLLAFPPKNTKGNWQALTDMLEPIAPRLYSIASSNAAHNEEVHICVARSSFIKNGKKHFGLASNYLAQLPAGAAIQFYVQKNNAFHLPADDTDIIMVGPGTGIAPFRAFVAERDARGATGRNWLFFGDQHFKTDFLYQAEWQNYLETGALTRLDVAFSRDTEQKVYVQHKMLLHAAEIYEWLQNCAVFYVCGAKHPMGTDVENALLKIIAEQSGKGEDFAVSYLATLKDEGRYLKDVY